MATNYKIEADDNLTLALEHTAGYGHLSTAHLIALAQVNATLALAEQQRIANLIAFLGVEGGPYKYINEIRGAHVAAITAIREGLGL